MSYTMEQRNTEFFMDQANLEAARKALRQAMEGFKWFNPKKAHSLDDAVAQCDWALEFDDNDNVIGIEMLTEYQGEEKRIFDAIAPYVKAGSYIQMSGEDGSIWRWVFDGTSCREQKPVITWQDGDAE